MSHMDRRKFLAVSASGTAALSAIRCARASNIDSTFVMSVGDAVLPDELGREGTVRIAQDFLDWVDGYRPGAELNHAYGDGALAFADELPIAAWTAQLRQLDTFSHERFSRSLADATREETRTLIQEVLQDFPDARLGNPARAQHIAVAILSFFYRTAEATDLAYRVSIKKQQCRPLGDSPNQPIALG